MAAISKTQHEKLMGLVSNKIMQIEMNNRPHLHCDVQLLEQLHERYQNKLLALRKLIADYEAVQRRVRVELRKQQVMQKPKQFA